MTNHHMFGAFYSTFRGNWNEMIIIVRHFHATVEADFVRHAYFDPNRKNCETHYRDEGLLFSS